MAGSVGSRPHTTLKDASKWEINKLLPHAVLIIYNAALPWLIHRLLGRLDLSVGFSLPGETLGIVNLEQFLEWKSGKRKN